MAGRGLLALAAMKRRGAGRAGPALLPPLPAEHLARGQGAPVRRALWRGFAVSQADTVFPGAQHAGGAGPRHRGDHARLPQCLQVLPCHRLSTGRAVRSETEAIRGEVEALVESAGYRQLTLSSLSSGDFASICTSWCASSTSAIARGEVSFSLPSLRVDSLSLGLLKEISEVRKSGLTFAVETARPEWQREVRKTVTLDKIDRHYAGSQRAGLEGGKVLFHGGPAARHTTRMRRPHRRVPPRRSRRNRA